MKMTINFSDFKRAFKTYGREDNFSCDALREIFDCLEEVHDGDYDLDVIAICCDFSESSVKELVEYYDIDVSECEDDYDVADKVEEYLKGNTSWFASTDEGYVYLDF